MFLNDDPIIRCDNCKTKIRISKEWIDYDFHAIDEKNMGTEYEYVFSYEGYCEKCNSNYSFRLKGYEYPLGTLEYQNSESDNCDIIFEPTMKLEFDLPEPILSIYEHILNDPSFVYKISSYEFENFVAEVYHKHGFNVSVTPRTHDGGRDVIATSELAGISYLTYFQCKHPTQNRPVDVDVLRSLYGVMQRDRIDKGVIVTTSRFTKDCIKEAQLYNGRIKLVDYNDLQKLM